MPELPEVETIRRSLEGAILGKKITDIALRPSKVVRAKEGVLRALLIGRSISSIGRVGKLLIFSFSKSKEYLLAHLKMTGQFIYIRKKYIVAGGHSQTNKKIDELPNKYTHLTVTFSDQSQLFFNDMRLFAYLDLVDEATKNRIVAGYGPEPLTKQFTLPEFTKRVTHRNTSIKAVLLNQTIIAGIGNIYADEICFAAHVRPARRASSLTAQELQALFTATNAIIKLAIKERGTTFNSYVDGAGKKGNFLSFLQVYGRDGEPCRNCNKALQKTVVAERGTVFCADCQK